MKIVFHCSTSLPDMKDEFYWAYTVRKYDKTCKELKYFSVSICYLVLLFIIILETAYGKTFLGFVDLLYIHALILLISKDHSLLNNFTIKLIHFSVNRHIDRHLPGNVNV